jgi:hypothetical protein
LTDKQKKPEFFPSNENKEKKPVGLQTGNWKLYFFTAWPSLDFSSQEVWELFLQINYFEQQLHCRSFVVTGSKENSRRTLNRQTEKKTELRRNRQIDSQNILILIIVGVVVKFE